MQASRRELVDWALFAPATDAPALRGEVARPGKAPRVRITDIESFSLRSDEGSGRRYAVTRVYTDAGIVGTSFLGCPQDVLAKWVKPTLVGRDLFNIDDHLNRLQMQRGESGVQSWSGVEHAMWDAVGRCCDQPVAKLLGGGRDRLRVYRTTVWGDGGAAGKADQSDVPYETIAAFAVKLKQAGYTAMKIRAWRPRPLDNVAEAKVIKAAVGPNFALIYDRTAVRPGWVWDYDTALAVARGFEEAGVLWLEEPFDGYDIQGPARLAAEVDIPITGGELGSSMFQFLGYLTNKTYDIVQPDARICGGLWVARKISALAEAFGVPCILHGTDGPALAGYIQASCAMPNSSFQEIIGGPVLPEEQWRPAERYMRSGTVFRVEKGDVLLPPYPGLGLDVSEEAIREFRVAV